MEHIYDMIIVGGGPAGYTAALYAARSGLSTVVLEKLSAGGQMALTEQIDNYPGFAEGIDGFTLGERMQQGAERFGAVIRADLEKGRRAAFGETALYRSVFAIADAAGAGNPVPRARIPDIALESPKITRALTTAWFAGRVDARWNACMKR